ncbi:transposase [Aeromonas hydrophila]|uniref:transposase n=1 Tax=Aeromonas hydrophila TaxID=644 RepID=UPI00137A2593|nr:transposase [Aeromonas hydrophila]EJN6957933.1 transposase [Aeromonas hydrophila]MCX4042978.1 transposase [Aeromonas hydrophila]
MDRISKSSVNRPHCGNLHTLSIVTSHGHCLAQACCDAANPVFYEDEVYIDLNPKLEVDWMFRAQQMPVVTRDRTPNITWQTFSMQVTENTLLQRDKRNHRFYHHAGKAASPLQTSQTITRGRDNYIIHKSQQTERWLKKNPKFCLVFQPVYSPWINHIEPLWHKLHETVTRNHQCRGMANLLARLKHFMDTVSYLAKNSDDSQKI